MKEMQYDSKSGMSQLVETNVSQANARQRAGRAGRVRSGTCYFLYTQFKSNSLPAQQLPEMLRAPLEQLCLRIKSLNLGSIAAFLSRAIEPPSAAAIEHVVEVLRNYNALERREEVLTPLGYHLAALPVDARIGKMMMSETGQMRTMRRASVSSFLRRSSFVW
jgi:HrpA-like RNA helicase